MQSRQILHWPKGRETTPIQGLDADSLSSLVSFYDWPLLTGLKLGDATTLEISAACEKYERDAQVYQRRAAFLRLVEQALPSVDATVREVLTSQQISAMAESAGILLRGDHVDA